FDNDSPWLVPALFINGILYGSIGISATIIAQSMIADCVEDSQRRTGRRSEGLLFSAGSIISKAISGTGVFIAGAILAVIHFPQGAKPGQVDDDVIRGLALGYLPVVATLYALGVISMLAYRIDRQKHEENLAALGIAAAAKEADVVP
ncbi:MAG: MFS transporter, partial [Dehalococcoidia bacterium]|nr:MFS transporter [Dehalococcoidia bacterium]